MDPTAGPAPRESIDDVVRELRGSVGDPSFAQIAQRITERRIARGLPPLGAALTGGLFTSVADKLISGAIALAAVSLLPAADPQEPATAEETQPVAPQEEYAQQTEGYGR